MADKNCLVKDLEIVETLGSTSTILVDQKGTLTQNRMTVSHLWFDKHVVVADISDDESAATYDKKSEGFMALARATALCNRASFKDGEGNVPVMKRDCSGNACESALLKFFELATGEADGWKRKCKKVYEVPFSSTNKYYVSICEIKDLLSEPSYQLVMTGAPELIFERCSTILVDGRECPIGDEEIRDAFNRAHLEFGGLGEHIVGFCDLKLPVDDYPPGYPFNDEDASFPLNGLRFVGMIGLVDPLRPAVPDAIAKCRSAGIKVIVITDDHPITAKTIAKKAGIFTESSEILDDAFALQMEASPRASKACIIHGSTLREMTEEQLDEVIAKHSELAFARTSSQQKLIIIESCQRHGEIVAVVGGNDAGDTLALKQADIGIAMGISGSDVSKQAAGIILLDDNFSTVVHAIEEGRVIFENLKKSIAYTLTSNISKILPFIVSHLAGIPLPLETAMILCIDFITDLWPTFSLAYEEAERHVMKQKPRNPLLDKLVNERLISFACGMIGIMQAMSGFFAYFVVMGDNGFLPTTLVGIREQWDSEIVNDLEDSYGQQWVRKQRQTYAHRKMLERASQTAFFVAIVVVQWANLMVSTTLRNSIIQHGMRNWRVNLTLIFETCVCAMVVFCPGLNSGLGMSDIRCRWWFPALPFAILIFIFDEFCRYLIRRAPGGWVERKIYY